MLESMNPQITQLVHEYFLFCVLLKLTLGERFEIFLNKRALTITRLKRSPDGFIF